MAISRANEADILVSLHRGARDDAPWSSFLRALQGQTGAERVGLVVQSRPASADSDTAKHFWPRESWSLAPGQIDADLCATLFNADALDPYGLQRLRADRVYALAELADPTDIAKTALTVQLGAKNSTKYLRIMRVSPQPGTDAWVVIARGTSDLSASASALLSSLAPHVSVAVLNYLDGRLAKQHLALTTKASARLGLGWVVFSPEGAVIDLCKTAHALMINAGFVGPVIGSRLVMQTAAATKKLGDAFGRLHNDVANPSAEALVLSAEPRLELLLCPPDRTPLESNQAGAIVGYLRGASAPSKIAASVLESLFGLAASEAKFALLLGQAKDITSASAQLGLTIETGRNYSKKIYAKTGVTGQAELIYLFANGVSCLREG